jgi:hypothetical protein
VLGDEKARAVVDGRVVRQLGPTATGHHVPARAGHRVPEFAATERPGVAAVEDDHHIARPGRIGEFVDPHAAHRRGQQIGGLGVVHAQVQPTQLVQLAVPAEIDQQHIVAIGRREEGAQRAYRPGGRRLGKQGDVDIGEQAGVPVR